MSDFNLQGVSILSSTTDHPCFTQPVDEKISLWKYMDFTKFVSLLSLNAIFLCRSDRFRDPYEGSFPKGNLKYQDQIFSSIPEEHRENAIKFFYEHMKWGRAWTYISCWHVNKFESAAMWDLYAKTDEAIAIETTYEKLKMSLPETTFLGLVNYIDYETAVIPSNNAFYPYMNKRLSFEHENEARVVMQDYPFKDNAIDKEKINDKNGTFIQIDLGYLINKIHVSPTASSWLTDLVEEVTNKYSLSVPVVKSNLYSDPLH